MDKVPSARIGHLDLDCFFAQVEELKNPLLKGKPLVVGADPKGGFGRGVVCTANYAARAFGIRSAMPISQAFRLCPQAVFLHGRYHEYSDASRAVLRTLQSQVNRMQPSGIDEAFFDLSDCPDFQTAKTKAQGIKNCIRTETGLTCSVGLAWNKPMAKLATDLNKPDGLTVIEPCELESRIWPLEVGRLSGVGPKTQSSLEKIGIKTIGDLAHVPLSELSNRFGSWGFGLRALACGFGSTELHLGWDPKSTSRERTFSQDTTDPVTLERALDDLARRVHRDVEQEGVCFRTVTVKIRFDDFETHTKSKSVRATQAVETVVRTASDLVRPALFRGKKIRLLGVRLSHFSHGAGQRKLDAY